MMPCVVQPWDEMHSIEEYTWSYLLLTGESNFLIVSSVLSKVKKKVTLHKTIKMATEEKIEGNKYVDNANGEAVNMKDIHPQEKSIKTEEIIGNFNTDNKQYWKCFVDIDLNDPDVEAAAVKIQAAFGRRKSKKDLKD